MFPDEVEFALHIREICSDSDDGFFIRNDDDKLSGGSVSSKGVMAASPHLVAISLKPIAGGEFIRCCVRILTDFFCSCGFNPLLV